MAAVIWLIVGLLLIAGETLSGDLFLLMLGGGALAAAVAAVFGAPVWLAALVFALISVLLVVGVRPVLKRKMTDGPIVPTGIDALIGRTATTLDAFGNTGGQIRIDGDVWSAEPADPDDSFNRGEQVIVERIDGATAVVSRPQLAAGPSGNEVGVD